jgi:Fe-S-cluster containining protein
VTHGDNGAHHTVVSREEALMIASVLSCPEPDMFMTESNTEVFIKMTGSIFPDRLEDVARVFPLNGEHTSLSVDCFGRCTLLGSEGCILGQGEKPLFCRIYPFWFINGILVTFNNDRCLALQQAPDLAELMVLFGVDEPGLREIYDEILLKWFGVKPENN